MIRSNSFVLCFLAALAISACNPGGAGSAGEGGSGGAGGGGEPSSLSCTTLHGSVCSLYTELGTGAAADAVKKECGIQKGTVGTDCPKDGLLGCCALSQSEIGASICYYSGGPFTLATAKQVCGLTKGGVWSD